MPSLITVSFLLWVIVIGSAVALVLLLLTVAVRTGRALAGRHRARLEDTIRVPLLRAVTGQGVDPELTGVRGGRGRAVNRLAFAYLARVRGAGHDLLADLLRQRGVTSHVISLSALAGRRRRAAQATRLGLIAPAEAGLPKVTTWR